MSKYGRKNLRLDVIENGLRHDFEIFNLFQISFGNKSQTYLGKIHNTFSALHRIKDDE